MKLLIAVLSLVVASNSALAAGFDEVLRQESTITFTYQQMGVNMDGTFGKFSAQAAFDPARLDKAQARIEIDLASIDTGVDEANDEVAGKLWFDTKNFPAASFVATGVKTLGGNHYEAIGKLTIKGRTQDVVAPFTFQPGATRGVFDGVFTIKRLDFNIGEGLWADVSAVANEIQIKFHLVVAAAPRKK
ncbi:YceI family protein [Ferrigenium sp. UT5]|uniref:YceI family protein n=1 Tax=Ferrigenium sp. UT5 TaxID=3242105 RepID=UPI003551F658